MLDALLNSSECIAYIYSAGNCRGPQLYMRMSKIEARTWSQLEGEWWNRKANGQILADKREHNHQVIGKRNRRSEEARTKDLERDRRARNRNETEEKENEMQLLVC